MDETVVGTYDKRHKVLYTRSSTNGKIIIKFRKHKQVLENAQMLARFLTLYRLSDSEIQACQSPEALRVRLREIETGQGWCHDLVDTNGVHYVEQQKEKPSMRNQPLFHVARDSLLHKLDLKVRHLTRAYAKKMNNGENTQKLPVLEACVHMLNHPLYRERYHSTIDNSLIVMTQQGFATVEHMIRALLQLGIPPQNIILFTKPHTTTQHNRTKFHRLGIQYIAPEPLQGHTPADYKTAVNDSVENVVAVARAHLARTPAIKNIVLHDEGGSIIKSEAFQVWINALVSPRSPGAISYRICTSEHTISGLAARQANPLPGPCISMAKSFIKTEYEARMIAEASFRAVENDLHQFLNDWHRAGRPVLKIGVIGCGNIGSEFVKRLVKRFAKHALPTIEIHLSEGNASSPKFIETIHHIQTDVNVKRYLTKRVPAMQHGMPDELGSVDHNAAKIIRTADIVFGCTGQDVTRQWKTSATSTRHTTVLYSLSSGYREFKTLLDEECIDSNTERECYRTLNGLHLVIKNWGRPINFNGGDHAVDPFQIQIIRAATVCAIAQDLSHLSLSAKMSDPTNQENQARLLAYHQRAEPFTILDPAMQFFLSRWFDIAQKTLRAYCHEKASHQSIALKRALVQGTFFHRQWSLDDIIHGSDGDVGMKMDDSKPHPYNDVGRYDKNHKIYLLEENGELKIRFYKHGKIIRDNHMRERWLVSRGFSVDQYLANKEDVAERIAESGTTPFTPGLFQPARTPKQIVNKVSSPPSLRLG